MDSLAESSVWLPEKELKILSKMAIQREHDAIS
jgi:hypothetical protein